MKIILVNVKEVMNFYCDILVKVKEVGDMTQTLSKYIEVFEMWIDRHKLTADSDVLSKYVKGNQHVWAKKVGSDKPWKKISKDHPRRSGKWEIILY